MTMDELQPGQSAYITAVGGEGALRHHLLDMGLTPGTEVTLQKIAPMGDPVPFVMELPNYRLPSAKSVLHQSLSRLDSVTGEYQRR